MRAARFRSKSGVDLQGNGRPALVPMSVMGGKQTLAPLPNGCQWPQANHLLLSKEPNNPAAHFIPLISHG